MVEISGFEV